MLSRTAQQPVRLSPWLQGYSLVQHLMHGTAVLSTGNADSGAHLHQGFAV